jgi:hypothetical protein
MKRDQDYIALAKRVMLVADMPCDFVNCGTDHALEKLAGLAGELKKTTRLLRAARRELKELRTQSGVNHVA